MIDVVVLGLAGIQRGGLGGPRAGLSALLHPPHDLLAPPALIAQHRPRHPPDLGRQLARRHRLPLHPQPPRRPTRTASRPTRLGLQIAKRGADSGAMRRQRLCRYPRIARGVEHRDRLGRTVGHIPARDPNRPRPQHLPARRVAPLQQRPQLTARSGALQSQSLGAAAEPLPRRLAPHRVVILGPARDLALVVVLVPSRELAQAQHDGLWKIAHTHPFNVRDRQLPHRTCQCKRVGSVGSVRGSV